MSFLRILPGALLLFCVTAHANSPVRVTHLSSFHQYSESVTTPTSPEGWPGAQRPTAPPLYIVHPTLQRGYLYGGFAGQNQNVARSTFNLRSGVGLYWLRAVPGVYERLAIEGTSLEVDDELYGRINSSVIQGPDDGMYGTLVSALGERDNNYDENGRVTPGARYLYTDTVQKGVVFRADYDGTHMRAVTTPGELNMPNGTLVYDGAGHLFGLDKGSDGHGRLFRVTLSGSGETLSGSVSTVHEFGPGAEGRQQVPNGLILGSDGMLYGVTAFARGAAFHPDTPSAATTPVGTLYRIDPATSGSFTVLHTFTLAQGELNASDNATHAHTSGSQGLSWLVEGPDGWLYGGTGPSCQGVYNSDASWLAQGTYVAASPQCGALERARNYGTLSYPYYDGPLPHGALYRISRDGQSGLQILHVFSDTDGSTPRGPLTVGDDGNIYGTTLTGGPHQRWYVGPPGYRSRPPQCDDLAITSYRNECLAVGAEHYSTFQNYGRGASTGTLFRIAPARINLSDDGSVTDGGFESLHTFLLERDGAFPLGVRAASDGNLYGVTAHGGVGYRNARSEDVEADDQGAVFQVSLDGDLPQAAVTLTIAPGSVRVGEEAILNWTTFQADQCEAYSSASDWTGPVDNTGTRTLRNEGGTYRYTLVCVDTLRRVEVSDQVTLYVGAHATTEDGNEVNYGNGGGGAAAWWLLAGLGLLGGRRFASRKAQE